MDEKARNEIERLRLENEILLERKGDDRKSLDTIMRLRLELRNTRIKLKECMEKRR